MIEKEFSKINKVKIEKRIVFNYGYSPEKLIQVTKKIIYQMCIKLFLVQILKISKKFQKFIQMLL